MRGMTPGNLEPDPWKEELLLKGGNLDQDLLVGFFPG